MSLGPEICNVRLVESGAALFSGDVAMNAHPGIRAVSYGIAAWCESLAKLDSLEVEVIVPRHGGLGDGSLIDVHDDCFARLQSRVAELKGLG